MTNNLSEKTKSTLYEVSFDNDKPHGAVCEVEHVKPQGPVFVVLPGNGFNQHDMGYKLEENVLRVANKLRKYLESAGIDKDMIKKLPFYVVTYQSPDGYSDKDARTLLYKKHGRNNMPEDILKGENGFSEEEKNPAYIEQLYRQIAEARVSRLDGKVKVSADTAAQNMAQVFVFAHCHGAYTALKLEEVMKKNMQKLGYTNEEIGKTQKQIIVTAYAPACPLGVSKMNFVSFKSLNDTVTKEEYNNISVYASMQMDDDRMYWLDKNKAKKRKFGACSV